MLNNIIVKKDLLANKMYDHLFSVEEVNKLVLKGVPFRDAYLLTGKAIEEGSFKTDRILQHTHEGSAGNLCNPAIQQMMTGIIEKFNFNKVKIALEQLLR